MRRLVPPFALVLFLSAVPLFAGLGCTASHGTEDAGEGGRDAGVFVDACLPTPCPAPPFGCGYVGGGACDCGVLQCDDAGPAPDGCVRPPCAPPPPGCAYVEAGPCDCGTLECADAGCSSVAAGEVDVVCFDGAEVPTVDVVIHDPGACYCGEAVVCSATQVGNTIDLSVHVDACGPLCDACFPQLRGSCRLDDVRLTPSPVYDVRINGRPALFGLQLGPPRQCWSPAGPADGGLFCAWPGTVVAAADITDTCVPTDARPSEPVVVRATACLSNCFDIEAGCEIHETATGFDLVPLRRACECPTCGACAPQPCYEKTFYCTLPPIEAEGAYTVTVAGTNPSTLAVSFSGDGNASCDDRAP